MEKEILSQDLAVEVADVFATRLTEDRFEEIVMQNNVQEVARMLHSPNHNFSKEQQQVDLLEVMERMEEILETRIEKEEKQRQKIARIRSEVVGGVGDTIDEN